MRSPGFAQRHGARDQAYEMVLLVELRRSCSSRITSRIPFTGHRGRSPWMPHGIFGVCGRAAAAADKRTHSIDTACSVVDAVLSACLPIGMHT